MYKHLVTALRAQCTIQNRCHKYKKTHEAVFFRSDRDLTIICVNTCIVVFSV